MIFLTPEYPPRHGGVGDSRSRDGARACGDTVHVWGPSGAYRSRAARSSSTPTLDVVLPT